MKISKMFPNAPKEFLSTFKASVTKNPQNCLVRDAQFGIEYCSSEQEAKMRASWMDGWMDGSFLLSCINLKLIGEMYGSYSV